MHTTAYYKSSFQCMITARIGRVDFGLKTIPKLLSIICLNDTGETKIWNDLRNTEHI